MALISKMRIWLYNRLVRIYPFILRKVYGMHIGKTAYVSRRARLDRGVNPKGIYVGEYTRITGDVLMLAHDECRKLKADTRIGSNCFIGTRSIILPGVSIGNEVIIAAGSVVTKDIPDNCIAGGNPAKIIREDVHCREYGVLRR